MNFVWFVQSPYYHSYSILIVYFAATSLFISSSSFHQTRATASLDTRHEDYLNKSDFENKDSSSKILPKLNSADNLSYFGSAVSLTDGNDPTLAENKTKFLIED